MIKKLVVKSLILFLLVTLVTSETILGQENLESEITLKNIEENSGLIQ